MNVRNWTEGIGWNEMNGRKWMEINCFRENDGGEMKERGEGMKSEGRGRIGEYGDKVYRIMEIQKHKLDWLSK